MNEDNNNDSAWTRHLTMEWLGGAAGTGAFFTPPDVLDAVTANPPMPPPDADMEAPKEVDDE